MPSAAFMPTWVISQRARCATQRPLHPRERTSPRSDSCLLRAMSRHVKTCGNFSDESRSARQDNPDLGKCTGLCIDLDCARVLFHDDVVTDREAKARTFSRRLGREERFKHLFFHVRRNACAVIANPDLHMIAKVFGRGRQSRLVVAMLGLCVWSHRSRLQSD